ncbi:SIMPL domain-containing protein [Sphingomonas sp. ac-8]|uniref:SIMPL domain-containing protein n=1 Tax=Sphingomonas sp. ac-8 TaxID=3242977 RepID=UPI003A80F639
MFSERYRSRRSIGLALLPSLVALAACGRTPPDPRGLRPEETLLSVSGIARIETVPDQATFTAGMSSIGANAQAASARNAEIMNRITAALAKLNIPERDLQTRGVSLGRIEWGANRGKYEASNTVAVRVRDAKQAGPAIAAVTAAGANIVSGPDLTVSDPEKASLGAYGAAYRSARAKAEAYAAAANLRIARVLSIRDASGGGGIPQMMDYEQADRASPQAAPPPVLAGTNSGTVATSVDFVLKPR